MEKKWRVASGEWRAKIAVCLAAGLVIASGEWRVASGEQEKRQDGGVNPPLQGPRTAAGQTQAEDAALKGGATQPGMVPRLIKYSGTLKDSKGAPKSGAAGVTFAIYAEQEGGAPLWMETQNVTFEEGGKYTVFLGANSSEGVPMELFGGGEAVSTATASATAPVLRPATTDSTLPGSSPASAGAETERWLGVEGPDIQQTARVLLVSVPYALRAADAETLGGLPASAFVRKEELGINTEGAETGSTEGTEKRLGVGGSAAGTGTRGSGEWRVASGEQGANAGTGAGTTAGLKPGAYKTGTKTGTGTAAPKSAATTADPDDFVSKFNTTGGLIPSAIYEANGNVGIGTTNPQAALHVNGNTVLVNGGSSTAQVQVTGAASSGRFGQDANGSFLASDTSGSPMRFLTNTSGNLNEWMRIASTGIVNIGSAHAAQLGEIAFAPDSLDRVQSVVGQAGSQYHFRLSRAAPDTRGARDFLISPYAYGMALEYPGVVEVWSQDFSVHAHPSRPGLGAYFWVGDEIDSGGLLVTARDNGGGTNSYVTLAANRFDFSSHGSLNFVVRNPTDTFRFAIGPVGSERVAGRVSGNGAASSLDLFSGTVQATVRAQSVPTGSGSSTPTGSGQVSSTGTGTSQLSTGVQIGSTSNDAVSLFTNNGAAQVTLFPSGNFSIGNTTDTATLAVGTAAQFQVSAAGATTIGGGTAITRHLSVSAGMALAGFKHGDCQTVTVKVAGAVDGDTVALGIPNALAAVQGLAWLGWVSAADTVSVRVCNVGDATVAAPPAGNVRVDVWQH